MECNSHVCSFFVFTVKTMFSLRGQKRAIFRHIFIPKEYEDCRTGRGIRHTRQIQTRALACKLKTKEKDLPSTTL